MRMRACSSFSTGTSRSLPRARRTPNSRGALLEDRRTSLNQLLADEFSWHSRWSDAPDATAEIDLVKSDATEHESAFKVPSLRNVAQRAPYMHAGQFATLAEVIRHYNEAPPAPSGHSELKPLHLDEGECAQIEAFLRTLSAPPTL